jgi:uncharacterized protein YutE (UPF0331/DUF86 family)
MDREVIDQKLESLRRCIKRAREKCPTELDALVRSFDLQDIITLNLTRAVQLCVDIGAHMVADSESRPPDTMSETFDLMAETGILDGALAVRLKKAVGFRNISVHNFDRSTGQLFTQSVGTISAILTISPVQSCPTWENSDRTRCVRTICWLPRRSAVLRLPLTQRTRGRPGGMRASAPCNYWTIRSS